MTAQEWIDRLGLVPHPEGGFFCETWRSAGTVPGAALPAAFGGDRSLATAILYLLRAGDFSAFHRLRSDELWFFHDGADLEIHHLVAGRGHLVTRLGVGPAAGPQAILPAGEWFAARLAQPASPDAFVLVGCVVAPGFDFADFDMARRDDLAREFPGCEEIVVELTRDL